MANGNDPFLNALRRDDEEEEQEGSQEDPFLESLRGDEEIEFTEKPDTEPEEPGLGERAADVARTTARGIGMLLRRAAGFATPDVDREVLRRQASERPVITDLGPGATQVEEQDLETEAPLPEETMPTRAGAVLSPTGTRLDMIREFAAEERRRAEDQPFEEPQAVTPEEDPSQQEFERVFTGEQPEVREGISETEQEFRERQEAFRETPEWYRKGRSLAVGLAEGVPLVGEPTLDLLLDEDITDAMQTGELPLSGTEQALRFLGTFGGIGGGIGAARKGYRLLGTIATKKGLQEAGAFLSGISQARQRTRLGGALVGAAEGVPLDLAFAVEDMVRDDRDLNDGLVMAGIGTAVGAVAGTLLPGGESIVPAARLAREAAQRDPERFGRAVVREMDGGRRTLREAVESAVGAPSYNIDEAFGRQAGRASREEVERITGAAVIGPDGQVHTGENHAIAALKAVGVDEPAEATAEQQQAANNILMNNPEAEGFQTTQREFVSRAEAARVGTEAGQISDDALPMIDGERVAVSESFTVRGEGFAEPPKPLVHQKSGEFHEDAEDLQAIAQRVMRGETLDENEIAFTLDRLQEFTGPVADELDMLVRGMARNPDDPAEGAIRNLADEAAQQSPRAREKDVMGFASREWLQALAGAGTGGLIGAATSDEPGVEDEFKGAFVGAVGAITLGKAGFAAKRGIEAFRNADGIKWVGGLPERLFRENVLRQGRIGAEMTEVNVRRKQLLAALEDDFGLTPAQAKGREPVPEEIATRINESLTSPSVFFDLPEKTREAVDRLRTHIDVLSLELERSGLVEGPLAAAFDRNFGFYMHRAYRIFEDPEWINKIDEGMINRVKSLIRREFEGDVSAEEMENIIRTLVYDRSVDENPLAVFAKGGIPSKVVSILKRRKDIPPEIRALWGELDDPLVNYSNTIQKQSALIANSKFLRQLRDIGMEQGWLFKKEDLPVGEGQFENVVQIAGETSDVMEPLNGLYTTPEMAAVLDRAFNPEHLGTGYKAYLKALGAAKAAKTVLSPMTHIRNATANFGFLASTGHLNTVFNFSDEAVKTLRSSLGMETDESWLRTFKRMQELGVVKTSARAEELRALMDDALDMGVEDWLRSDQRADYLENLVREGGDLATRLYRAEDDFFKVLAWHGEMQRYADATGMAGRELEEFAARRVRDTFPTYDKVPPFIQRLRRSPFVGMFVSFPAEVYRTLKNNIKFATEELASDNEAVRAIGRARLQGMMMAGTVPVALAQGSRMIAGISLAEEKAIREHLPPWQQNSNLVHFGRGDDGELRFVDLSYTDPYAYISAPLIAAVLRGGDWDSKLLNSAWEGVKPFLGEELFTEKMLDITRNKKGSTGGPVWDEEAPVRTQSWQILMHFADAFVPGAVDQADRIWKGARNFTTEYGRSYDFGVELSANVTGVRVSEMNVERSLDFKARRFSRRLRNVSYLDGEEVQERQRNKIYDEFAEITRAAMALEVPRGAILRTLRDNRIAKRHIREVLRRLGR